MKKDNRKKDFFGNGLLFAHPTHNETGIHMAGHF